MDSNNIKSAFVCSALSIAGCLALVTLGCSEKQYNFFQGPGSNNDGGSNGGTNSSNNGNNNGTDASMAGGDAATPPTVEPGALIVVGAQEEGGTRVLSVLDEGGLELSRDNVQVAGIAYDPTESRDIWYVFKAADFPADPLKPADLDVRRYNLASNTWEVVATYSSLPPPRPGEIVVLNRRLAYLSYTVMANVARQTLTILDTSDLENVTEIETTFPSVDQLIGLKGLAGSEVNPGAVGGVIDVFIAGGCRTPVGAGVNCTLTAQPKFVGDTITDGASAVIGNFTGIPAFNVSTNPGAALVAMLESDGTMRVSFNRIDPRNPNTNDRVPTTSTAPLLGGVATVDCEDIGAFTERVAGQLFGLQTAVGTGKRLDLGRPAGGMHYEPFSKKMLIAFGTRPMVPDASLVPFIGAYSIEPDGPTNLTLEALAPPDWMPPADIRPLTMEVRHQQVAECP